MTLALTLTNSLVQPDRREDEEKFDEDRAKRQDTADQDAKERVHVPEVENSKDGEVRGNPPDCRTARRPCMCIMRMLSC